MHIKRQASVPQECNIAFWAWGYGLANVGDNETQ